MEFRQAKEDDLCGFMRIYGAQMDREERTGVVTGWRRGVYPTEEGVRDFIRRGEGYVLTDGGECVACGRINRKEGEYYARIPWRCTDVGAGDVLVLHTFAVDTARRRAGYGTAFVRGYIALARALGCRVARLDTVETNAPALAFYPSLGFYECGRVASLSDAGFAQVFVGFEMKTFC